MDKNARAALSTASLQWRNSRTPLASDFDDVYFSAESGLEESRFVFLKHNHLEQRFSSLNGETFYIAETGFGTGLNFLACWQLWQSVKPKGQLQFFSIEKHPLTPKDLELCLRAWPELAKLGQSLLANYPALVPGLHRLELSENVTLDLYFGDVIEALDAVLLNPAFADRQTLQVNAWFLDGFAPSKNPEMWSDELFTAMARLSAPQASVATFTAAGFVRRGLNNCGFEMKKTPGCGSKREMLEGYFHGEKPTAQSKHHTPWYAPPCEKNRENKQRHAIIGAGIAGSQLAFELGMRGINCDVFEKNPEPGMEASGNEQGILYAKVSGYDSQQNRFVWHSHLQAFQHYQQLFEQGILAEEDGRLNGVLQLAYNAAEEKRLLQLNQLLPEDLRFWSLKNPEQSSDIAGCKINHNALFMPRAGWLNPASLCKKLLHHSPATVNLETGIDALENRQGLWHLHSADKTFGPYDKVYICNAGAAQQFEQCDHLPLQTIRGQTNLLPANAQSLKLKTSVCHKGYIPPAHRGQHCFGSSFILNDSDCSVRDSETKHNLDVLQEVFPDWPEPTLPLPGKAAIRYNSPDYLPVIGAVADADLLKQRYANLAKDAHKTIAEMPACFSGLFVNIAHGSRGLASSVLAARFLADITTGKVPGLEKSLVQAISPSRFLIRDIIRREH